eukprot:CAMPEP_0197525912 /NCGR_PEP_ID=MMETSP1318-20131121/15076_1 /TAXON_ID=552666 /ORGANISM="Partenskyella glossopodia, Strain RCC365" /LENGTH=411 /DNA_ID=CAMNT_0043079743 /DNA_START=156 /DNA_END=1388 /DNA_ORIENTATION=+
MASYDTDGGMSKEWLRKVCDESEGCYVTPELNNKLYLQHKCLTEIENLEEYVNVSWLYLQNNAIDRIQNIGHLKSLTGLFLGNNEITKIQNLDSNSKLKMLNLDRNFLKDLKGIEVCKCLENFSAKANQIQNISPLSALKNLTSLNLQNNKISDEKNVLRTLSEMPKIRVLYLKGNPFVRSLKNYRKEIIHTCPDIQFLDDRPVEEWEKKFVAAWKRGGMKALIEEREKHNSEKWEKHQKMMDDWKRVRLETHAKKAASTTTQEQQQQQQQKQQSSTENSNIHTSTSANNTLSKDGSKGEEEEGETEIIESTKNNLKGGSESGVAWDVWMDRKLFQLCRKHMFDFPKVCNQLKSELKADETRSSLAAKLSIRDCRIRSLHLDRRENERRAVISGRCVDAEDMLWDAELMPW